MSDGVLQACTKDVGESERAEYWVETCRAVWGDIQLFRGAATDIFGAFRSVRIASSQVTKASLGNMDLRRPRPHSAPFYSVAFSMKGRSEITNDGRQIILQPAHVFLIDSTRPTTFRIDSLRSNRAPVAVHDKLSIQLPARMIRDRLGPNRGSPAIQLDRTSVGASIVWQFAKNLYDNGAALDQPSADFVERQLCDLIAFCFGQPTGAFSEDTTLLAAHRQRLTQWIAKHYADERLSPRAIAAACGISVSYLHKIYRGSGRSVMEHVRDVRLDTAHAQLQRSHPATTISEIAYSAGYRSLSDFSRAYKHRFGYPPSSTRS